MEKRAIIIGTYNTAAELWTLREWSFSDPEAVTEFVHVPGRRKGPLDMSTALTDGDPVYNGRTLTAVLESSEGTRMEREARIERMFNGLDGLRFTIVLPDDPLHYIEGRVSVAKVYNDLAHASVKVTAECEPWRYNHTETIVVLNATSATQTAMLVNSGRLAVVPRVEVSGGDILLKYGEASWALSAGAYELPDLLLMRGSAPVTYSGAGVAIITYREAVL